MRRSFETMTRPFIVMKFGGTSVASAASWRQIADQVVRARQRHRVWIVSSALAGVTDLLDGTATAAAGGADDGASAELRRRHEALAGELRLSAGDLEALQRLFEQLDDWLSGIRLTGEVTPRLRARILATGELAATRLGAAALTASGVATVWIDARDLLNSRESPGMPPEARFLEADVEAREDVERADRAAGEADAVITQGFVARTPSGETCLLGRGGSDTSAALLASLSGAARLEIWTDVPGLFTADPRLVPTARLIRKIGYREAEELAAMGAKVLHPRCLGPAAKFGIPVVVRSTLRPEVDGTHIARDRENPPAVTAVTCRRRVVLLNVSTLRMWRRSGFLSDVFTPFRELDLSVDLVGTSQTAVSVTLDDVPGGLDGETFAALVERLESLGRVRVVHPCAVISIVGRKVRAVLHELGPALEEFKERPVHLVSDSAEDRNISFVVDEGAAPALVARIHERLFSAQGGDVRLGPTWEMIERSGPGATADAAAPNGAARRSWWSERREPLIGLVRDGRARFVYHLPTVRRQARRLRETLTSVEKLYYAMKANGHPELLAAVGEEGFGIECVSAGEVERARNVLGGSASLLFTPNFCPIDEYRVAFEAGAEVTVEGEHVLEQAPQLFAGTSVGLRVDPGEGLGHHRNVRTAGAYAKFGLPLDAVGSFAEAAARARVSVVGLHAHVGSGVLDPEAWARTGRTLARLCELFPGARWLDAGGGLGVPERPGQDELDLVRLEASLADLGRELPDIALRLEPGRYLVSEAGVLLAPVTQVRRRRGVNFAGLPTGMNSLIRPALYGSWHAIHNLSRLDEPPADYWHVVGPICESTDVLGRDRWLPRTTPGDVLLIENAGAYGAAMASSYNLRPPAAEVVLDDG